MSFLSGMSIAVAAALTVPPLVALYFLKLRRQPQEVSSTLLWKQAIEDLHVNAPFQRIRNNLLLWLQLLVLLLAALALGRPVMEAQESHEDTVIVLIDQSASMSVEEAPGRTRLDEAKDQAKRVIENLPRGSRAMVIGFADRATIASSFETDPQLLRQRIDEVPQTDSTTTLSEAITLAEAYMQNLLIAGEAEGDDIEVSSSAGPARAVILTDGNIRDARRLTVQKLPADKIDVVSIGSRSDNVGIVSMNARRNFERPQILEVFAMVRNFGESQVSFDASLYINDNHADVQSITLAPGRIASASTNGEASAVDAGDPGEEGSAPPPGSVASITFDEIEYEGGGVVEIRLSVADALRADNRAWTVVKPPRNVDVLLVSAGNFFLERLLTALPLDFEVMSPDAYESASDDDLMIAGRLKYDVVVFENHDTDRLPPGSYVFFGGVPKIESVERGGFIEDEVIFNWNEAHAVLRYVAVETIQVFRWLRLTLPTQATVIIEGESSPIMGLMSDGGRQFLICAFGLLTTDDVTGEPMLNTDWMTKVHFPIFLYNAVQYLSGSLSPEGAANTRPGEPIEFAVPQGTESIRVRRPDGEVARVPVAGMPRVNYADTRRVGVYMADSREGDRSQVAVNLFDAGESDVAPRSTVILGGERLTASEGVQRVNKPLWNYALLAILAVLFVEWAVYCKRVFV